MPYCSCKDFENRLCNSQDITKKEVRDNLSKAFCRTMSESAISVKTKSWKFLLEAVF